MTCLIYLPKKHNSLESYLCSRASEEDCSEQSSWDGKPLDTLNSIPIASKSCNSESKKATSTTPLSSGTSLNSSTKDTQKPIRDTQTSSPPDSRVSHFRLQGSKKAKQTAETNGQIPSGSFGKFDPHTSCLRTYQQSLLTRTFIPYSMTWPKAGMIVSGIAYEHQTRVRRTKERGSGLWPSPRTRGLLGGSGSREMIQAMVVNGELSQEEAEKIMQVKLWPKMWPTPANQEPGWKHIEVVDKDGNPPEHPNQRFYNKNTGRLVQKGLGQVARMWPTPTTQEVEHPDMDVTDTGRRMTKNGKDSHSIGLADQVHTWPTPAACSREGVVSGGHSGLAGGSGNRQKLYKMLGKEEGKKMGSQALNPDWVEWLMGFPIG